MLIGIRFPVNFYEKEVSEKNHQIKKKLFIGVLAR